MLEEVKRNKEFIEQYGEGNFGHTWALWSEIEPCLDNLKEYALDESTQWETVFGMVQELCQKRIGWMSRERIEPD